MVNIYDVGDAAPLTLTVDAADDSTVATVLVTRPDGTAYPLAASPSPDRTEWTTALLCTAPGLWRTRWTVVGLGAGTETHTISVRGTRVRRGYAHTGDLAGWVDVVPGNADALLAAAERVVDRLMIGALWDPVSTADPRPAADPWRSAYRDAVCAQVAAWVDAGLGDDGDADTADEGDEAAELARFAAVAGATSMSFGPVSFGLKGSGTGAAGSDASTAPVDLTEASPAAVAELRNAGVWPPRIGLRR